MLPAVAPAKPKRKVRSPDWTWTPREFQPSTNNNGSKTPVKQHSKTALKRSAEAKGAGPEKTPGKPRPKKPSPYDFVVSR